MCAGVSSVKKRVKMHTTVWWVGARDLPCNENVKLDFRCEFLWLRIVYLPSVGGGGTNSQLKFKNSRSKNFFLKVFEECD